MPTTRRQWKWASRGNTDRAKVINSDQTGENKLYTHRSPESFKSGFQEPQFAAGVSSLTYAPEAAHLLTQHPAIVEAIKKAVPELTPDVREEPGEESVEVMDLADTSTAEQAYEPEPVQVSELEPSSDLQDRAEAYAGRLAGVLWEGIENYKLPSGDEGLRARRAELLFGELSAVIAHAGEFFADAHTIKMAALAEEHERVRIQCRAALDGIRPLMKELGLVDGSLRSKQLKSQECRVLFNALSEGKPKPEQYLSKKEIAAWETSVEEARAAVDAAQAAEAEIHAERGQILREIRDLEQLLHGRGEAPGLKHREVALRAQLEGKPYRDHHTGFDVPPEF
jgi:hypothetical protein